MNTWLFEPPCFAMTDKTKADPIRSNGTLGSSRSRPKTPFCWMFGPAQTSCHKRAVDWTASTNTSSQCRPRPSQDALTQGGKSNYFIIENIIFEFLQNWISLNFSALLCQANFNQSKVPSPKTSQIRPSQQGLAHSKASSSPQNGTLFA